MMDGNLKAATISVDVVVNSKQAEKGLDDIEKSADDAAESL